MKPCQHEEITWEPVDLSYNSHGTAEVWQHGTCIACMKPMNLIYTEGKPTEEKPEDEQ